SGVGEGPSLVSARERRCVVHSGRGLHSDQELPTSSTGVCPYVRCTVRFSGGLSVYRAHAAATGIRSHCGGVFAEGNRTRSQVATGALFSRGAALVQVEDS